MFLFKLHAVMSENHMLQYSVDFCFSETACLNADNIKEE